MDIRCKKLLSLFLIFSLFTISCSILDIVETGIKISKKKASPVRKKGAKLIIQKVDNKQIIGELISVRSSSLLLLDEEFGVDISVLLKDIKSITIKKKTHAFSGPLIGAASGAVGGAITWLMFYGLLVGPIKALGDDSWGDYLPEFAAYGLLAGAAVGLIVSGVSPRKETFQIEGKSDSEVKMILAKLSKKARIRDYK